MPRPTETISKRWKVAGDPKDPNAEWKGGPWGSQPPSEGLGLTQVGKWIEDMEDWCEMMHESMLELRERVAKIERLPQELHELSEVVKELSGAVKGPQ